MRNIAFLKHIAVIVSVMLFFEQAVPSEAHAALPSVASSPIVYQTPLLDRFEIPEQFAKTARHYSGTRDKTVLLIQDAHVHQAAQKSIAGALTYFVDHHQLKQVYVEGADGDLDTEMYSFFPNKKALSHVANYYLDQGRLTGAEFASIVIRPKLKLQGIEDKRLYEKNRQAYLEVLETKENYSELIQGFEKVMKQLSRFILPEDLRELSHRRYEGQDQNFQNYARYIIDLCRKQKISLKAYPSIQEYAELGQGESDINEAMAKKEFLHLLKRIETIIPEPIKEVWLDGSSQINLFNLKVNSFLKFLKENKPEIYAYLPRDYAHLNNFFRHVNFAENSAEDFLMELEEVTRTIEATFKVTEEQAYFLEMYRVLEVYKKMFKLNLTKEDVRYFQYHRESFNVQEIIQFLKPQLEKYKFAFDLPENFKDIESGLSKVEKFYTIALNRDQVLASRAVEGMEKDNENLAAMIVGGFHVPGIEAYLREQGYSYLVLTPQMKQLGDMQSMDLLYHEAMTHKPMDVEKNVQSFSTWVQGEQINDTYFQLVPELFVVTKNRMTSIPQSTLDFYQLATLRSLFNPEVSPAEDLQRLKSAIPFRRERFLEYALSGLSPGVLEKRANGNHLFWKPIASEKVGEEYFQLMGQVRYISADFWHTIGSFQPRSRSVISWGEQDHFIYVRDIDSAFVPEQVRSELHGNVSAQQPQSDSQFFLFRETRTSQRSDSSVKTLESDSREVPIKPLQHFFPASQRSEESNVAPEVAAKSEETVEAETETPAVEVPVEEIKPEVVGRVNVIPELISIAMVTFMGAGLVALPIYFVITRVLWVSAFLSHGFGHVLFKRLVDRNHKIEWAEASEGFSFKSLVKNLLPFSPLYTPWISPAPQLIPTGDTHPVKVAFKALGGPLSNFFGAAIFLSLLSQGLFNPYLSFTLATGFLVYTAFALLSVSDYSSFFRGAAECGYGCGILWVTAERDEGDDSSPYPKRIESVLSNVLYYMSLFGSHGVGAAAQFVDQRTGELDYTHFKMPSGYGQNPFFYQRVGRTALIQQFLQFFKTEVSGAESRRAVAGKRWNIAGHVRLKTSGGKLEVETTQPFYINPGEKIRYWSQEGNQMVMHEVSNIAYSAANGDNQKARLPGDQEGPYYGEEEWGKFFSKIYGVPIGANDSEKAGYMIYFLRTAGSLRDSLRLAYLATFFKSLNDPIPSTNQFEKWARLLEPMIEKYGLEDWSNPELLNKIVNEAITILPRDESATRMPQENYHLFLEYAFRAFQKNDGYQAAKTMMTMVNEYSTYGLFYESTLEPGVRVVISREQPVAIAENLTKKIQLGGSSLNFLKISLWRDTSYEQGDRLRTLKLDMTKAHDDHGGEIARLNYNHGTTEMYSMNLDRELSAQEVEDRWKDATNDKPDWIAPTLDEDPMLNDLMVSLAVAKAIRRDWTESPDNDASALSAARAFSKRWAQNARKLDRSNRVLQDAGIDVPAQHAAPDLFIVVFREENITVGEWFRKLMQETYPLANIKIVNGNEYIQSIESYPLYLNTNTFFIDLGFNFPIIRTAEEHERRAKKNEAVTLGESSDLWGTDAAKTQATWNVLKLLEDRKPPHTFILTPTQGTNISESFDLGSAHVISSKYFPDVDGGTGVSWSQIISLLELYHYVLKDMRREFPEGAPLGMTLSQRDIRGIQKSYEHMIRTDIPEILGFSLDAKNKVTQLDTPAHQNLERLSEELLPYFTEQVRATALSTVHLLVAVAFTGTVIQIAAAVVLNGFGPLWGLPSLVLSFLSHLFDVPLFLFFKWMSVIYFRLSENRELLHRDQNPAIVIGDDQWSRLIRVNLSKMFALAKGIVSPTGIYDSKQLSELEGKHGHDARRGTMIFLSGPPNRTTSDSVAAGHQGVGLIQSQAESFASINAVGPLIVGIMDSPESRVQSMKLGHQASIHSQSREAVQGAEHFDNPQKAGRLLEIAMGGPLRMLAHQVVFVNIVKKLQHLKLAYPLSWHRGDNQNSIGATTQAPIRPPAPEWISGAEKIKKLLESLKKPFARTPQPRAEEDVSATTDTEVRIERKLPGGILLSKDGHRPGKRSELRSIPDPAKLSIEALEKRNMLSGDLAKLSPDVSEIPTTDTVEVAKSFEQAVASKERAVIQIVGSEEVSYDPQGKTVEIAIRYNSGDEAFEFRLVNFISDSTGKTKSFYLIELKNGNFVQLLEGGITKYNAEGKALEGEVIDSASNRTLKFFFATSKNPLPNKQELVLVVSKMVITTETTRTEVKINLKNISFVEAEDGEEEVAKKAEPERVLEPERPIFPKENPLVSQAGPSSSVAPASDGTDSSVKIDDDPSIGLSPDDAMKLLPKVPDITAPIVDVAEGVMDDVIPLGEIEELVLEDGQVEGEAVEKTVALVPLTPAVHVVTNKSSNLSNQRDYDDEPSSFIVRWFLGMAAILGAAFLKIEKLFSGAAFPVLFISGAAFYSFVPASLWVFAPGLLGFFILATFVTRGKTDAKPQVSLGSSSNVLLLYFPKATGIEIKLPNGKKIRKMKFERERNHYEAMEGQIKAVYDYQEGKYIFSIHENANLYFVHTTEEEQSEQFLKLEIPYKDEGRDSRTRVQSSLKIVRGTYSYLKFIGPIFLSVGTVALLSQQSHRFKAMTRSASSLMEKDTQSYLTYAGLSIENLYWASIASVAIFSLLLLKKIFPNKKANSFGVWFSQLLFLGSFFLLGKVLLVFYPMPTILLGISFFYLFTTIGYFTIDVLRWVGTVLTIPFRWIPGIARLTTPRQTIISLMGLSLLSAGGFLIYERVNRVVVTEKKMNELLTVPFKATNDLDLQEPIDEVKPAVAGEKPEVVSLVPLSYEFKQRAPLIYDSSVEASSVEIIAPANGYLNLNSENPVIAPAEWIIPKSTFEITGQEPLLEVQRPDVDLKAQNVGDLAKYLEGIHEDFDASGIYNILPRATRLFTLGEGLAKRMENYRDQQMVDVFGEIKVPLRKDERGWILPSPRTLGNTTDESILALVHSQNRLTVQIAVPIAVWKNHDLTGMQVRVRLHDDEVPARIVKMDLQPRLSGQLIVTLGLVANESIFEWDNERQSPKAVDVRVEIPLKFKSVSYSEKLPPSIMTRSYAQFDQRVSVPVNPTEMTGRVDFKKEESSWVFANEVIAGISADDRISLEEIIEENAKFTKEAEDYLKALQWLRTVGALEKYPKDVQRLAEYFVAMQEMLGRLNFFEFRSPQMGILTETFESQGQAFVDKPIAQVITPEITIHQRIKKQLPVSMGDIVIVRRAATGEEILGIVRQINEELPTSGVGDDQSNFREVLIQVYNTPDLWFADHEYGIEVIYVSDERGQTWLKKYYDEQLLRFKSVYGLANKNALPSLFPIQFVDAAVDQNRQLLIQAMEEGTSLELQESISRDLRADEIPLAVQKEQSEDYAMPASESENAQINRIVRESNGGLRREWMSLFLQNPSIPLKDIEYLVLEGPSDVGQLSLDYLLAQHRVLDLIHLHRELYAKSPELDMTKLARAHVLELIEMSDDSLKRLVRLDHYDENRAEVQEFFISLLAVKNSIFDYEDSIVARKIISSDFWRTYGEQLALADAIEKAEEDDALYFRRKALANLIRNHVFLEITKSVGWSLGEPEEHAQDLNSIKRFDREIWYRLHNITENDKQDREWLETSPWTISYEDPREYFNGRINQDLFEKALKEYETQLVAAEEYSLTDVSVLDFKTQTGPLFSEHVFKRLDAQNQRVYVETLQGHALERFLEIAERAENVEYRQRLEQIVSQLVKDGESENRLLLARIILKTDDPKIIELLIAKEVDHMLIEALGEMIHSDEVTADELLLYQQAVIKISGTNSLSEGVKVLAMRTVLQTLSDFELKDFLDARHGLIEVFKENGVSEDLIKQLALEEIHRRAGYWAIDLASEWSHLTLDSQVYSTAQTVLENLRTALQIEGFYPDRLKAALKLGFEKHPEVFSRYDEFYQYRVEQILRGPERDRLNHLETARLSIGVKLGLVSLILGVLIRIFSFFSLSHSKTNSRKGWFSKLFIWSFFAVGFYALNAPASQAQSIEPYSLLAGKEASGKLFDALDSKEELTKKMKDDSVLDFSFYEEQMKEENLNFDRIVLSAHQFIKADLKDIQTLEEGEIILNFRTDLHSDAFVLQLAELMRSTKSIKQLAIVRDRRTLVEDWNSIQTLIKGLEDFSKLRIVFVETDQSLENYVTERNELRKVSREAIVQVAEPVSLREKDQRRYGRVLLGAAPLGQETMLILGGEKQIYTRIHFMTVTDILESLLKGHQRIAQSA